MFLSKKVIIASSMFILFICAFSNVFSQKKCGTVEYNQLLKKQQIRPETEDQFENWIKEKSFSKKHLQAAKTSETSQLYTIPVVVHVIHNGESLGTGGNISDVRILAQLDSLNKDFRRLNADTVNTPLGFRSVAVDTNIEFVLAKRDPEGLATTGIIRKQGLKSNYSINEGLALKTQSYWPAEDYLNLWITDLNSDLLGYAQFPTSNLQGLDEEQSISRLTDGVVLDWKFTGTNFDTGAFASLGRTGTHEIGHFLGLRHIWGDGGCTADDFCADTPFQGSSSKGCPEPGNQISCNSEDMFQNFMDFSDDACMNLFTTCQSDRMRIILENSPRRKSLLTSKGGMDPIFVSNDLGIKEIISPLGGECTVEITPQLEVKNYGSNDISNFTIDFYINDVLTESIDKIVSLSYLSTNFVSFSPITNPSGTTSKFRFEVKSTNLSIDGNSENNSIEVLVNFPTQVPIPFMEDFENDAPDWSIINSAGDNSAMEFTNAPNILFENKGFKFSYFESSNTKFGERDWLLSPVFDFSALPSADLKFKYAHSPLIGNISDVLTVAVSTDCGITFQEQNYIYQEFSPTLGTTSSTTTSFTPEGPSDWKEVTLNLTDFTGNSSVIIAFIGHNGNGNNIFIDDFELTSDNILAHNLGITDVSSMPLSTCQVDVFPTVDVKNFGFEIITDFDLKYTFNGNEQTINTSGTTLLPGKIKSVFVPLKDIIPGNHQIQFEILNPNGNMDEQTSNNVTFRNFNISDNKDVLPIREQFEQEFEESEWDFIRADAGHNFFIVNTQGNGDNNRSLLLNSYNLPELGVENWLISPELDFTQADSASLIFKVSYAKKIGRNDKLEVKISTNCGLSFNHTLYSKKGSSLAVKESIDEWFPETQEDWITEIIDLSDYTVWPSVKVAFVITSQNGNNVFLDNIEFFDEGSPTILDFDDNQITIFPNPASENFKVKFDIDTKDILSLTLIDMAGNIVFRSTKPNILNQEFEFNSSHLEGGIYILHANGNSTNISKRVVIVN